MSSLRLLSAFFCLILTLMLHAAPFPAPSSCGSFKIEKTEFLLHVFEKDWKMTRKGVWKGHFNADERRNYPLQTEQTGGGALQADRPQGS